MRLNWTCLFDTVRCESEEVSRASSRQPLSSADGLIASPAASAARPTDERRQQTMMKEKLSHLVSNSSPSVLKSFNMRTQPLCLMAAFAIISTLTPNINRWNRFNQWIVDKKGCQRDEDSHHTYRVNLECISYYPLLAEKLKNIGSLSKYKRILR